MKKPVISWQKISGNPLPVWNKQAVARFANKFTSPLVLMESPEWSRFSGEQSVEWDAMHIRCMSGMADASASGQPVTPPGIPTQALLDYAEKSITYFHNYSCTTHLLAVKSGVALRSNSRFAIGSIWNVF